MSFKVISTHHFNILEDVSLQKASKYMVSIVPDNYWLSLPCEPICLVNIDHSFDHPHTYTLDKQWEVTYNICQIKEGIVQNCMSRNHMLKKIICMVFVGFLPISREWITNNFVLLPLNTLIKCKFHNFFSNIDNIRVLKNTSFNFF